MKSLIFIQKKAPLKNEQCDYYIQMVDTLFL